MLGELLFYDFLFGVFALFLMWAFDIVFCEDDRLFEFARWSAIIVLAGPISFSVIVAMWLVAPFEKMFGKKEK